MPEAAEKEEETHRRRDPKKNMRARERHAETDIENTRTRGEAAGPRAHGQGERGGRNGDNTIARSELAPESNSPEPTHGIESRDCEATHCKPRRRTPSATHVGLRAGIHEGCERHRLCLSASGLAPSLVCPLARWRHPVAAPFARDRPAENPSLPLRGGRVRARSDGKQRTHAPPPPLHVVESVFAHTVRKHGRAPAATTPSRPGRRSRRCRRRRRRAPTWRRRRRT